MPNVEFIWDLEEDQEGNVEHIAEHGVTIDEAEQVVRGGYDDAVASRRTGRPTVFGFTSTGKHLAVVFDDVDENLVYVVTAFEVPAPAKPKRRRRKQ